MSFEQAADQAEQKVEGFVEQTETQPAQQGESNNTTIQLEDGSIVVNGRVYRPDAAVKKIEHADKHIQTLEQENAKKDELTLQLIERLEKLEGRSNHEDQLKNLLKEAQESQSTPIEQPQQTTAVSKEEIINETLQTIQQNEENRRAEANFAACVAQAKEVYGSDYGHTIDTISDSLGMTTDAAIELARNNPLVFKKLFLDTKQASSSPDTTRSSYASLSESLKNASSERPKSFLRMSSKERARTIQEKMSKLSE